MNQPNHSLCTCGCCEESQGLTPLNVENNPGLSALQYRVGKHGSFKESMLRALSTDTALTGLTARFDDDMAIATLDAWATVLDVLTFYQERIINEGYLRTATERLSVSKLARHISYRSAPGVASGTFLAFSMNDAPGSPDSAAIATGTKVQSIPEQDQLPQTFETVEDLNAKVEWNSMAVLKNRKTIPVTGDKQIYLDGINTGLQPGDGILMIGQERENDNTSRNWDFRKVQQVIPDNLGGRTLITWNEELGKKSDGTTDQAAKKNFKIYALRQRASLFGFNAPDFRTLSGNVKSQFIPSGLLTEIYSDMNFGTVALTRIDGNINNDWGSGAPAAGISADNFSIRWSGVILPPVTGQFTFYTQSDDGVQLLIDNTFIISNMTQHASIEDTGSIWLQAGQLYNIQLDYFEASGFSVIKLSWSGPGLNKDIIPASSFFQPGNYSDWPGFTISAIAGAANTVYLDAIYSKITKGGWLMMKAGTSEEVYKLTDSVESSRIGFAISSKSMAVTLDGINLSNDFDNKVRETAVFAQSEELVIAESPVGDSIKNDKEITLDASYPDLQSGKTIIVSGKRCRLQITEEADGLFLFDVQDNIIGTRNLKKDDSLIILSKPVIFSDGSTLYSLKDSGGLEGSCKVSGIQLVPQPADIGDDMVSEVHTIDSLKPGADPTVIVLRELLINLFDISTVVIYGNVARSTHGETKLEVLGSGDSSMVFQKFDLKQSPLTFVSAASASGTQTTLQIRVNDILWKEVPSFYGVLPGEKVYTTSIDDNGTVTVEFGDGVTGSRLPTGVQNVKATYRVGIGTAGDLNAGQLSMILKPVLGVSKVINPLASAGGADPELRDTARQNAPLTVLTLDRIVSARDLENFTRAFAGIGKARAEVLWSGEQQVVHVTIAASDQQTIDKQSDLYLNLLQAIQTSGHTYTKIYVDNYIPIDFTTDIRIKADSNYLLDDVMAGVVTALIDAFSFDARGFGQDVTPAELISVIQGVAGVVYTDLQGMNGTDPFTRENFRLTSGIAHFQGSSIIPAELLLINPKKINITPILP
jgi:hypothetical protein